MGNCVLSHKSTDPAMQFCPQVAEPGFDQKLRSAESSKAEMFFDSQAWLDSDTEDYFSINGDFTPSRGNAKTLTRDSEPNAMPQPPKSEMNKQLFELFCESFGHDTTGARELEDASKDINFPDISTTRSPYRSMPDSDRSGECQTLAPNRGGYPPKKDKSSRSAQCCFPGFCSKPEL